MGIDHSPVIRVEAGLMILFKDRNVLQQRSHAEISERHTPPALCGSDEYTGVRGRQRSDIFDESVKDVILKQVHFDIGSVEDVY